MHRFGRYLGYAGLQVALAGAAWGQVSTAPASADVGVTPTQLNAVASAIPAPCNTVPSPDTVNGTVGSGNCFVPATATRPGAVQRAATTTDSNGAFSVTWARPFSNTNYYVSVQPVNPDTTNGNPIQCNPAQSTMTTTVVTGTCWYVTKSITLPGLATSLLGLILNIAPKVPAGVQVRVAGADATQ